MAREAFGKASSTNDVASAGEIGGRYCEDCRVAAVIDAPSDEGVMRVLAKLMHR